MAQDYLTSSNPSENFVLTTKYMQGILSSLSQCPNNKVVRLDCQRKRRSFCGKRPESINSFSSFIIGSFESESQAWPWSAYLQIRGRRCGATVIQKNWVLTAAHCVSKTDSKKIKVRTGNLAIFRNDNFTVNVKRIVVHPDFKKDPYPINDLALIEVKKPLNVTPICLPKIDSVFQGRKNCFIAGWGRTMAEEKTSKPVKLREAHLHVWLNEKCELFYTKHGFINSSLFLCGGYESGKIASCLVRVI